jgi:hypothetical protein
MKKNIWIAVLVAALAVMAIVVVRQNRQIAQLQGQLASAAAEKAHAPVVAALETEPSVPVAEAKPIEPVSVPAPAPVTVTTDVPPAGTGAGTNFFAGLAGMFKDPQMKEMMRVQQKMMLDQMYGGFYKNLALSSTDEDALKKLLLDRQMALVDAGFAAMDGSGSDTNQAAADSKAVRASYDKQIQDFLGPQGYDLFQQYDQTVAERTEINLFKQSLTADTALTDQQESDLIAAMYANRKALPDSSLLSGQTRDPSQLTEDRMAQALKDQEQLQKQNADSATAILSPAQLEQFTKFQQQMSAMQAAGMKMAAQMFGNKGTPQAPAANPSLTP